jgi:CDP-6-deoxy-D-xylo-4-hexulose-3-dehydrase
MNNLIKEIANSANPPYQKSYDNFVPGQTSVLYSGQWWDHREYTAIIKNLLTGNWLASGEMVQAFQEKFSAKYQVAHSTMVNSGSSANLIMFSALKKHYKWNDGDELIVSPVGFPTTIAPICQNNLKPVFVDIELDSLNFDVNLIESKITKNTRGIVVSPVLANPPDMNFLKELCDKHGILLIGDNCDSLGTRYNGELITKFYKIWTTSFYPAHHISTGEGGMISTDDADLIRLCQQLSWWGRDCYCVGVNSTLTCGTCGKRFDYWLDAYDGIIDHKYLFTQMGYNLKPLDFQGAIGVEQLDKADEIHRLRMLYKDQIGSMFETIPGVKVIPATANSEPSWFGVPIYCESQSLKEFLVDHLESNKIQTRSYFAGNILMHPGFSHLDDYKLYPNSNLALSNVFFLGCSPLYTQEVIDYIEKVVRDFNA